MTCHPMKRPVRVRVSPSGPSRVRPPSLGRAQSQSDEIQRQSKNDEPRPADAGYSSCAQPVTGPAFPARAAMLSRLLSGSAAPAQRGAGEALLMCNKKWSEQAPASEHRVYQNVGNLGMMAAPRNQDHAAPSSVAMLDGSSLGSTRKANRNAATVPGAIRFILGLPFSSNPNPTRRVRKARLHIKPTETICRITRAGMR